MLIGVEAKLWEDVLPANDPEPAPMPRDSRWKRKAWLVAGEGNDASSLSPFQTSIAEIALQLRLPETAGDLYLNQQLEILVGVGVDEPPVHPAGCLLGPKHGLTFCRIFA